MENILLKKSFRVKDLKTIRFNPLWGHKGIFTTIRLIGNKPNLILVEEHLKKLNRDMQHFGMTSIGKNQRMHMIHKSLSAI